MNPPDTHTIVALFVRIPVPGRVKTRLAQEMGDDGACELYKAMVSDIIFTILGSGFPIYLFHDGTDSSELPGEWTDAATRVTTQHGENIGERMAAAFEDCFSGNIQQVLLVGSDIPGVDTGVLMEASEALKSHDVAIAPAADGGYCLIALKQESYAPALFHDILWSSHQVLQATLKKCRECALKVELLKTLQDIDTIDDLRVYCRNPVETATATNNYISGNTVHLKIDRSP